MKIFKSHFLRIYFTFLIFATLNIVAGLALTFSISYPNIFTYIYYVSGIFVIMAPFITLLLSRDKNKLITSLKGRLIISKNDRKYKRNLVMFSKTFTWIFLISLILSIIGGVIIKLGIMDNILLNLNLLSLNRKLVFSMPFIMIIHVCTLMVVMHPKSTKASIYKIFM